MRTSIRISTTRLTTTRLTEKGRSRDDRHVHRPPAQAGCIRDQFGRAWDPGDNKPPGFQRAYHARNIRDEDEVISCGLIDMTVEDYRRWRADVDAAETQRVDRLSAFVENEHVSGVYGVVDVVEQ